MIYCLHMTTAGNHVVDQASQAHDGEERGPGLPIVVVTDSADALVVPLQSLPRDLIAAIAEDALADLLTSGHISGAGLDAFETEPVAPESPLLQTPNTSFSPPCAGYSDRSAWRLDAWTVADAVEWLRTGRLLHGSMVVAGTR
jgi:hypothetical protein